VAHQTENRRGNIHLDRPSEARKAAKRGEGGGGVEFKEPSSFSPKKYSRSPSGDFTASLQRLPSCECVPGLNLLTI
jgi:hypothetical protein